MPGIYCTRPLRQGGGVQIKRGDKRDYQTVLYAVSDWAAGSGYFILLSSRLYQCSGKIRNTSSSYFGVSVF